MTKCFFEYHLYLILTISAALATSNDHFYTDIDDDDNN